MHRRVICIIQARMASTRLPAKVMLPILDRPMLWWDMYRVQQARLLDGVIVATSTGPQDDPIATLCTQRGWTCFRGSELDVLDRYFHAAHKHAADIVVRVTSDCPLIEPRVIDLVVAAHLSAAPSVDYTSNFINRTFPRGLDCEVFDFAALETAWRDSTAVPEREHVTQYIYQHPDTFRMRGITNPVDLSEHRWTVDTPEDLELVRAIYGHFGHGDFRWQDVLHAYQHHPEWRTINNHIEQKTP